MSLSLFLHQWHRSNLHALPLFSYLSSQRVFHTKLLVVTEVVALWLSAACYMKRGQPRSLLDNSVEPGGVTYRSRTVTSLLMRFQGKRITTSRCVNRGRCTIRHDVSACYFCSLTFAFSVHVNPNYVHPCSLSLCSLLWKLLLAHPWIHMAALSLIHCHSTSPGVMEELRSSDTVCERRINEWKGRGRAL